MKKVQITATSTLVAQVAEGRTVDVIQDGGKIYLPMLEFVGGGASDEPAEPAKRGRGAASASDEPAEPAKRGRGAAKAADTGVDKAAIKKIFAGIDKGDLDNEQAEEELMKLTKDKKLQKALMAVLTEFTNNQDLSVDEITDMAVKALNGEEVEIAPDSADGEAVEVDDLEQGDRVTVTFGVNDTFDEGEYVGVVEEVKTLRGGKKKVVFQFDDDAPGDTMDYDYTFMTEIWRHLEEAPAAPAKKTRGKK